MHLETCEKCNRKFRIYLTAEERLLQAIFGKQTLCRKCALEAKYPKCTKCQKITTAGLEFNDLPYCPRCMGELRVEEL